MNAETTENHGFARATSIAVRRRRIILWRACSPPHRRNAKRCDNRAAANETVVAPPCPDLDAQPSIELDSSPDLCTHTYAKVRLPI